MRILLTAMNNSFEQSKVEQSKVSLDNSKLKDDFYSAEAGKKATTTQKTTKPSQKQQKKPVYVMEGKEKPIYLLENNSMEGSQLPNKSSRKDLDRVDLSYSRESSIVENSMQRGEGTGEWESELGV